MNSIDFCCVKSFFLKIIIITKEIELIIMYPLITVTASTNFKSKRLTRQAQDVTVWLDFRRFYF